MRKSEPDLTGGVSRACGRRAPNRCRRSPGAVAAGPPPWCAGMPITGRSRQSRLPSTCPQTHVAASPGARAATPRSPRASRPCGSARRIGTIGAPPHVPRNGCRWNGRRARLLLTERAAIPPSRARHPPSLPQPGLPQGYRPRCAPDPARAPRRQVDNLGPLRHRPRPGANSAALPMLSASA